MNKLYSGQRKRITLNGAIPQFANYIFKHSKIMLLDIIAKFNLAFRRACPCSAEESLSFCLISGLPGRI